MEFLKKSFSLPKLSRKQLISLVSLFIILLSLPLGVLLVKQSQIFQQKAVGPEAKPTRVKIANLHGGGFSISWTSSIMTNDDQFVATTGWVKYGTNQDNLNQTAYDDRGGESFSSTSHHVSLFNLNPETTYYFKIESGPDLYGLNVAGDGWVKSGAVAVQKTPITLELSGNPNPIYGFIKRDGNKVSDALVYVQLKKDDSNTKSALMSTVTKTNEGWVMDAKNARIENLTSFFSFDSNDRVLIDVQAAQNGSASDDLALSDSSPARDIITTVPVSTPTPTPRPTATPTPRPTNTPTPRPTATPTPTLRPTATPTPRLTSTPTPRPTATLTPSPRPTATPTPRPTATPTPTPTPPPPLIIGDINGDGCVDEIDYSAVIAHFLETGNNVIGDVNKDGVVDEIDYSAVIAHFLEGCD